VGAKERASAQPVGLAREYPLVKVGVFAHTIVREDSEVIRTFSVESERERYGESMRRYDSAFSVASGKPLPGTRTPLPHLWFQH
jgi:hypothetical protein